MMMPRVLRCIALGAFFLAADGNRAVDDSSFFQILSDRTAAVPSSSGSAPSSAAAAHFYFDDGLGPEMPVTSRRTAAVPSSSGSAPSSAAAAHFYSNDGSDPEMPVTSRRSPAVAPQSLAEFYETIPSRYSTIDEDVKYHNLGEQIMTLPMRRPRTFNVLIATTKTWLADMLVQLAEAKSQGRIDWRRSAAFALFGFFYVGLVQWGLYVSIMTEICPNAIAFSNEPLTAKLTNWPGQVDLLKQVFIDNVFFAALIYFPVFYTVKELVGKKSHAPYADGIQKYRVNFVGDNLASMAFWIPGDCLAFAAPIFLRLPIDHAISFAWTIFLSYRRGGASPAAPVKGGALVPPASIAAPANGPLRPL